MQCRPKLPHSDFALIKYSITHKKFFSSIFAYFTSIESNFNFFDWNLHANYNNNNNNNNNKITNIQELGTLTCSWPYLRASAWAFCARLRKVGLLFFFVLVILNTVFLTKWKWSVQTVHARLGPAGAVDSLVHSHRWNGHNSYTQISSRASTSATRSLASSSTTGYCIGIPRSPILLNTASTSSISNRG